MTSAFGVRRLAFAGERRRSEDNLRRGTSSARGATGYATGITEATHMTVDAFRLVRRGTSGNPNAKRRTPTPREKFGC